MLLEVKGCGDGHHASFQQFPTDQRRLSGVSETHCEIEPFSHHVTELISSDKFELQLGVALDEHAQAWRQDLAGEEWIYVYAQAAAYDGGTLRGGGDCLLQAFQQRRNLVVDAPAFVRHRD